MARLVDVVKAAQQAMASVELTADVRDHSAQDLAKALMGLTSIAHSLGRTTTLLKRAVAVTARGDNPAATKELAEMAGGVVEHLQRGARQADQVMLACNNAAFDLSEFVKKADKAEATRKFVFTQPR
ncbi:hypothetical protein [Kutzneria chonburiensis]|uniref:Uncharacterized protein n=1 Tax=Kutzneria chonburiensis TaxID=1483604 RepID=A0ABV6MKG4_9PSEU|nr:hypothetical protein [Kutzneria chonburiensis]